MFILIKSTWDEKKIFWGKYSTFGKCMDTIRGFLGKTFEVGDVKFESYLESMDLEEIPTKTIRVSSEGLDECYFILEYTC